MVRPTHLLLAAAATASLAGCGQIPALVADLATSGALAGDPTRAFGGKLAQANADGPMTIKCGGPGVPGGKAMAVGLMVGPGADLGLTAEQQAQIEALHQQHQAKEPQAPPPETGKAVRDAFLAEHVDEAALRAALQAQVDARAAAPKPDPTQELVAIRAILTDAQRAKLVASLQAQPGPKLVSGGLAGQEDAWASFEQGLALSAEQKAAVDAVKAKLAPAEPPGDPRAAMIAFWQDGDASGLVPPAPPALPIDEIVKAALVLDVAQRKALAGHGMPGLGGVAMGIKFAIRTGGPEAGMTRSFKPGDGSAGKGQGFQGDGKVTWAAFGPGGPEGEGPGGKMVLPGDGQEPALHVGGGCNAMPEDDHAAP
jgi:Spy/CpxP family protein refolding chaperone